MRHTDRAGDQELDLVGLVPLGQSRSERTKGVGLQHLGTGVRIGGVDRADLIGMLDRPRLRGALAGIEATRDELGAHGAV